ncbi:MAG: PSD1 and planctomycete cytochrome C domain-containing protein, partial [Planctomycetota bacterium]
MSGILLLFVLSAAALAAPVAAQHEGVAPAERAPRAAVDYLRDVRPILAQHCYRCHGPDEAEREGDLRLDRKQDAFEDRGDYAVVAPGDPADSELILRVTSDDPDEVMPPPECDDALEPAEVEVLRAWIAAGAPWQEHWAFVAPTRPAPPPVVDGDWPQNDVDAFVLAKLEAAGLRPSGEATREQWLRRVTFDLIGLPPTPEELAAFRRDSSEDAYAKVVDRLLADERYGERMATDWLDAARYADSSGYQRDRSREAWKWRDWVIHALNDNMPFDQFTVEQLAGDLLPDATLQQRIATGFNRNHPVNTEAGEELDEYRSAYVIDRVHTTATTFLGLTVACAQCHDHKYDPISQAEFYSFYGFFNSIKERDNGSGRNPKPAIAAPDEAQLAKLRDLEARIAMLKQRLEQDDPITDQFQTRWEQATRERLGPPVAWTAMRPTEFMARYGSRLQLQDDLSVLATGPTPSRDTYDLVFAPGKRKIQALRIEVLPDPSLPHGASGRADDGRFILSRLTSRLTSVSDSSDPPLIAYALAEADVNQERDRDEHYLTAINPGSFGASVVVDDGSSSGFRRSFGGWSISGEERKQPREAVLIPIEPLDANDMSLLRLTLEHNSRSKFRSLIGRFRVSFTEDPRVREQLLPLAQTHWRSIGPFPATSVAAAHVLPFGPEKDLERPNWKKKHTQPTLPDKKKEAEPKKEAPAGKNAGKKASTTPVTKPGSGAAPGRAGAAPAPAQPAPRATAKATSKPSAQPSTKPVETAPRSKAGAGAPSPPKSPAPKKRKPKRISWSEQTSWRDGRRASVSSSGPASVTYLSRTLTTARPRTARVTLAGGDGAKLWLNGELLEDFPPAPTTDAKPAKKPQGGQGFDPQNFDPADFDPDNFDPAMFENFDPSKLRRGSASSKPRELRIGLRAGENHLVVKLTHKGSASSGSRRGGGSSSSMSRRGRSSGPSFTFDLTAEGEDVLDYETLLAVRARADDPAPAREARPAGSAAPANAAKQPRTPAERRAKVTRDWYRTRVDVAGRVLAEELRELEQQKDALERKMPSALVMEELDAPRKTRIFVRGDYRNPGAEVEVGTPSMLPPMPKDLPKNRLGLARWLVSGDHPLTARVTVNRAWQQFFGRGIVSTAGDFGIRGAQPSHPQLLDWLASEFVQSGWDLKRLHRLITLSATYRQRAEVDDDARAADPDNVMLARGPHQRLSAEMVRDQALYAAGLLHQELGGESVKPHQPEGLWRATLGSGRWTQSKGDDAYRRGLYVYWKRGVPYPSFMAFDASKRETCTVTRTRTTTPLQALVTLNDPVYVEAGRRLGQRLLDEGGDDDAARIAFGFELVASRAPVAKEVEVLTKLLGDLRAHYRADAAAAKAALGLQEDKPRRGRARPGGGPESPSKAPPAAATEARGRGDAATSPAEAAPWAPRRCPRVHHD